MKTTIQIAFLLLLLLFSIYKVGRIYTDSKSLGLEMANVMALNSNKSNGCPITNDKGNFLLI
jgi:hypothetical protein